MLYAGAALMIGASVYGFVDYKKNSHRKEFTRMYTEEKKTEPVAVSTTEKNNAITEKVADNKTKTAPVHKKAVSKETVPDPVKPVADDVKMTASTTTIPEKTTVTVAPSRESSIVKTVKKKRKFSSKLFSRAPLRDEEEELPVPEKDGSKKTEKKEQ